MDISVGLRNQICFILCEHCRDTGHRPGLHTPEHLEKCHSKQWEKGHLPNKEGKREKLRTSCARPVVGGQFGWTLYPNIDLIILDHLKEFDFQNLVILLLFRISKMLVSHILGHFS